MEGTPTDAGERGSPVRILLVGLPRMLGDLIGDIVSREPDLLVVDEIHDAVLAEVAVERTDARFVIVGLGPDGELPAAFTRLMQAHPEVVLLGVAPHGRAAYLYELRPHAVGLGELSPTALLRIIRSPRPIKTGAPEG